MSNPISSFFNKAETDLDSSKPPTHDKDRTSNNVTIPIPTSDTNVDNNIIGSKMPPPVTRNKKDVGKDTNSKPGTSNEASTTPPIENGKKEMSSPSDSPSKLPAETKSTNRIESGNTKEGNPAATDPSS